jgi:NAD(P)H-flavin reductase
MRLISYFLVARHLGSQYYCYVAIALWASAIIWRYGSIIWHILRSGGSLPLMHITLHDGNDNLMTFTIPTRMRWDAGQHVFLRLPGCDPVASHPFTIASLPADEQNAADPEKADRGGGKNTMVFLVRAQKGFTERLHAKALKMAGSGQALAFPAIIDGPYGHSPDYVGFHSVMLVAGGTGISFALPILQRILRDIESGISSCKHIELIWVAKSCG